MKIFDELTRHGKYIDRHVERLRPGNGGGLWGTNCTESLLLDPIGSMGFQG